MPSTNGQQVGEIVQVIGSTFDAEFDEAHLPEIYNAVKIESDFKGVKIHLTGEVQQHLGGNRVRCVALGSTDGLVRGMPAVDTGGPVARPAAGPAACGRATGGARGPCRSARRRWAASSTCSASRSTGAARST